MTSFTTLLHRSRMLAAAAAIWLAAGMPATQADGDTSNPRVLMKTTDGEITIELFADKSPVTVDNFLGYVDAGHYDGTVFHRVIPNFMIQGGGFDSDMRQKATNDPITNEANNGLKNDRGTIAMARTMDPHSATAQFFINVSDNDFLNFSGENMQGWGYAVFGRVVEGEDVLDKIRVVPTGSKAGHQDVPNDPIVIESVTVVAD